MITLGADGFLTPELLRILKAPTHLRLPSNRIPVHNVTGAGAPTVRRSTAKLRSNGLKQRL